MDQLPLDVGEPTPKSGLRTSRAKKPVPLAELNPIAAVVVDVNVPDLDRPFDYLVPAKFADSAVPGTRVRVRFAGRLVDGYVLARQPESDHQGRLSTLSKVLGGPVLTDEVARTARAVADRYAGTLSEVLRDAIPPRHATAEKAFAAQEGDSKERPTSEDPGDAGFAPSTDGHLSPVWASYEGADQLSLRLAEGTTVRVGLTIAASDDPIEMLADLVSAAPGSAVVVVPDATDLSRFETVFARRFGDDLAILSAAESTAQRYEQFLEVVTGRRTIVLGTRSAVFAPVDRLQLMVIWDDGDDALVEPRAPGWHAREVASIRSLGTGASLVIAGYAQSVETARMVSRDWLVPIQADRMRRQSAARVLTAANAVGDDPSAASRLPQFAWQCVRRGLQDGPVLVQVGRGGYIPTVACQQCRVIARCPECSGPLGRSAVGSGLACQWCARGVDNFECPVCEGTQVRAVRLGSHRTAEELQSAFPGVAVRVSGSDTGVIRSISAEPQIVVATVGAEPVAAGRYSAAVLLDGNAMLARPELRAEEQLVRRWFNTVPLVKPASEGGVIAVTAEPHHRAVQALVRADPNGWAQRELADREATGLPPTTRAMVVTGAPEALTTFLETCQPRDSWRLLGPSPVDAESSASQSRVVVLAPTAQGAQLAAGAKRALIATPPVSDEVRLRCRIDPVRVLG